MVGQCRKCWPQPSMPATTFWLLVLTDVATLQEGASAASATSQCGSNVAVAIQAQCRALLQTGSSATFGRLDSSTEVFEELPAPWDSTIGDPVYALEPSFEARLEANPFILGLRRPNDLEVAKLHVMRYSEAKAPATPLEDGSGSDHESVFAIKYNDFNNKMFWSMAACLFIYTFAIDIVKEKVIHATRTERCNRVFVDRLFAELMVFGVVAMSVFAISQCYTMPMATFSLFEFSDILISFGAFFVIFTGIAFFRLRDIEDKHLEKLYHQEQEEVNDVVSQADDIKALPLLVMDRAALEVTRSQFFLLNRLDGDTFSWSIYVVESLNADICKFIEINQFTWLFLMGISVCIWLMHLAFGPVALSGDLSSYMVRLVSASWLTVLVMAIIGLQARHVRHKMNYMLGLTDIRELRHALGMAVSSSGVVDTFQARQEDKMDALKLQCKIIFQASQVTAVCMSVQLGFYFMHVLYNLVTFGMPWWWHLLFIAPPCIAFGLLLPYILIQFTHVRSFIDPDGDVIDAVIEGVGQAFHDLRFVQRQLEKKAQSEMPVFSASLKEYRSWAVQEFEKASGSVEGAPATEWSKDEFVSALNYIGVHVSKARAHRLFKVLAYEQGGMLKIEDFLQQMFDPTSGTKIQGSGSMSMTPRAKSQESQMTPQDSLKMEPAKSRSQRFALRRARSRRLAVLRHGQRYLGSDEEDIDSESDAVNSDSNLLGRAGQANSASSELLAHPLNGAFL